MNKQIQTEADELGFFGEYGGQYVPETLMPAIIELKKLIKRQSRPRVSKRTGILFIRVCRTRDATYAASYTESLVALKYI